MEILTPLWHVKAETARAVRRRIRSVLEWAIAMDLGNDNPCDRVLPVLGPQNDIVQHMRALPHKDVAAVETVRASGSAQPAVKLAFEFLVLTAARAFGDGNPLVFPMRSGRPISASTLPKMLQYHRIPAVAHGFRSSFRDWAAEETDHPREVIEAALAHVVQNKVEAAYARSDLFERRRRLMNDWAAYLDM